MVNRIFVKKKKKKKKRERESEWEKYKKEIKRRWASGFKSPRWSNVVRTRLPELPTNSFTSITQNTHTKKITLHITLTLITQLHTSPYTSITKRNRQCEPYAFLLLALSAHKKRVGPVGFGCVGTLIGNASDWHTRVGSFFFLPPQRYRAKALHLILASLLSFLTLILSIYLSYASLLSYIFIYLPIS